MSESIERMLNEVREQAQLLENAVEDLMQQSKDLLDKHRPDKGVNKIYITGCGDSWFAGIACQEIFKKYTGIHTEVYQALEYSGYAYPETDENSIVLSVSNSGQVARTVETAIRAREKGALAVGVTSNREGRLAQNSSGILEIKIPPVVGLVPGTMSYTGSMLALTCFAFALGEAMGHINKEEKADALNYLKDIGTAMTETVKANFQLVEKYVAEYFGSDKEKVKMYHILGSGPNFATAQFGTMKLLEAAAFTSIPQGIEEWAHTQYFVTTKKTHVIFVAPMGVSHERALEVMQAVRVVDGKVIAIVEEDDDEVRKYAEFVWPIKGLKDIREEFSAFIYPIPIEILSVHLATCLGQNAMDFERKPWKKEENFRQIFGSRIVSHAEVKK